MRRWLWMGLLSLLCAGSALATLHADPASVDFGAVGVGVAETRYVLITQDGADTLEVSGLVTGDGFEAAFPIHFFLPPGDSGIAVAVIFMPREAIAYTGTLQINGADPAVPALTVPLAGTGDNTPELTFELLSPENDATIILPSGTFVWETLDYPNVPAQACVYELWVIPTDSVNGEAVPLSVSTLDTTATLDLSSFADQPLCYWFVVAHLPNGAAFRSNGMRAFHVSVEGHPTGVDWPRGALATAFGIAAAAPNPFNPETRITLAVPQAGHVVADVFDVLGRKVVTLVDGPLAAGHHTLNWRPDGPAGLYLLRVRDAQGASDVRKLYFIK